MRIFSLFLLLALAFLRLGATGETAPVFEGIPTNTTYEIPPEIPVGKAVVLPISVYDDANEAVPPSITVTSSNPNIFVRVRTGNPLLKLSIAHQGTPAYSGDLVFQLFNQWTPEATGFIAGFAQAGFYDGLLFHRLANLSGSTTREQYIYQGGDPLGGVVKTAGKGGPGFQFDNEPVSSLIFKGRGQLALANSSFSSEYHGTNGSQFFITDDPLRELDFGYTILGQLTHGWPLLDGLRATPVLTGTDSDGNSQQNRPVSNVTITGASVGTRYAGVGADAKQHLYTEAVLLLSARRTGQATITVKAGGTTTTFVASAVVDDYNDPPFFVPLSDYFTRSLQVSVPFRVVDLEYDYVEAGGNILNNYSTTTGSQKGGFAQSTTVGTFSLIGNPRYTAALGGAAAPYVGPLQAIFEAQQWDPGYRAGYDAPGSGAAGTYYAPNVAFGVAPIVTQPVVVTGTPGTALTNAVVGRFTNADRAAAPGSVTAYIVWGDGKISNNLPVDTTGAVSYGSGPGGFSGYQVTGTHTFARAGVYTIATTLTGASGWTKEIHSTAVITANPIVLRPAELQVRGRAVALQTLATFTESPNPGTVGDYSALVDWGDGIVSEARIVKTLAGTFEVRGSHVYLDPETYSAVVRVRRAGRPLDQEAVVWTRVTLSGFAAPQHLPPFNQAHVSAQFSAIPIPATSTTAASEREVKQTVGGQTYLTLQLAMRNGGNQIARPGTLRIYLSRDKVLNKAPVLNAAGEVVEPADIPLSWGPSLRDAQGTLRPQTQVAVQALVPRAGITYLFQYSSLGDYRLRLPAGETGTGYNLIADLQYNDPLVPLLPSSLAIYGRLQGIEVSAERIFTSETGASATFTVHLDRKPTGTVTIPLTGDATEGKIEPSSLLFTPADWNQPQTVTVTGLPDSALPPNNTNTDQASQTYTLALSPAVSADPRYAGLIGPEVTVTNTDRDAALGAVALSGNATSATGSLTTVSTVPDTSATNNVATITLTLKRKPTAPVSVAISLSNTANGQVVTEGNINSGNPVVTFQPSDYDLVTTRTRTFHIRGLQDPAATGTGYVTYYVGFKASSTDATFEGITPNVITVTNRNVVSSGTTTTTSSSQ